MTVRIRPATPDDIPVIRRLLRAHDNDTEVAPGAIDIVGPYVRHIVDHHMALVSEDEAGIVGYGATVDAGRCRMLADLFVDPGRLGQGIGRPLLAAVFDGARARATFASDDPRALPLYVRAGMQPLWPNLYLSGDPARLPADTVAVRDAGPGEPSELELAWTGADRSVDHGYWAETPEVDGFVVEDAEGPVAVGYGRGRQVGTERVVDRLLVRPDAEPVGPILAAARRVARGEVVRIHVPGPNPALRVLLDAGFRIVDRDQYLASDPSLVDPSRLLPNPGLL